MVRYDSYATGGSAIYSLKNVEVYGSNFENNSGTRFVVMGRNVNASDCTFSNNSNYDPYGAGVLGAGINMNVDNCTFICNTSGKYGAAVYGTDVVVNNSKFINNTGNKNYLGSGIYSNGNLNVSNSLFKVTLQISVEVQYWLMELETLTIVHSLIILHINLVEQ